MRVPILTYHAVNISGNDYASNDHIALAQDLRLLTRLGKRIVPLDWVIDTWNGTAVRDLENCVVLTCDDGSDLDYFDLEFPNHGIQRSFYNVLVDFHAEFGRAAQPNLHLTCFVIADKGSRQDIDRGCLFSKDWMRDIWWAPAHRSGLIGIENHSFDHNHAAVQRPGLGGMVRGDFFAVDNFERAEAQISNARILIDQEIAPAKTRVFAYPFGHISPYLLNDYLPNHGDRLGLAIAVGDGAQPVTMDSPRWNWPRYICGWHWKSPDALAAILAGAS